jgi:hypothetical protein
MCRKKFRSLRRKSPRRPLNSRMSFAKVKTWQIEAGFVVLALSAVAIFTGNQLKEWIGAAAVLISFMHGQVSDRMAEDQASRPVPSVECHTMSGRYFIAKEILWLAYFAMSQTWSALVGVGIFLLYPFWRKYYRRRK